VGPCPGVAAGPSACWLPTWRIGSPTLAATLPLALYPACANRTSEGSSSLPQEQPHEIGPLALRRLPPRTPSGSPSGRGLQRSVADYPSAEWESTAEHRAQGGRTTGWRGSSNGSATARILTARSTQRKSPSETTIPRSAVPAAVGSVRWSTGRCYPPGQRVWVAETRCPPIRTALRPLGLSTVIPPRPLEP
jgi:hypothetical protein